MMSHCICGLFLIFITSVSSSQLDNPGVLEKIKTGLEYASSYIETAKEIADLVSESLGHRNDQKRGVKNAEKFGGILGEKNSNTKSNGFAAAFFRLLGLDSPKINAIAIGTAFNLKPKIEKSRGMNLGSEDTEDENWAQGPLQLILGSANEKIKILVRQARDSNLPSRLVEHLDGVDTACVRLLVCKASPVIWAAQSYLQGNYTRRAKWDMTSWIPSKENFVENGDKCEKNHRACQIFPER